METLVVSPTSKLTDSQSKVEIPTMFWKDFQSEDMYVVCSCTYMDSTNIKIST